VLIAVHHNLMARVPWEQVQRVSSKPEVFGQCRKWVGSVAKGRTLDAAPSTSAAAEMASREPNTAAIGSRMAAELYGLRILFEGIEDNPDNVTRFFVMGREPARRSGDDKTAIMFRAAHKPGALAEVLDVFKENGIKLSDIEKRPSQRVNWEYYFFIDADGHADDPAMKAAIEQARQHCLQLTVLGSYPRATEVL
jgi:chorismate mutase/prephenate dehydratase